MIGRANAIIQALIGLPPRNDLVLRIARAYTPDDQLESATPLEIATFFIRGLRKQIMTHLEIVESERARRVANDTALADVRANVGLGND